MKTILATILSAAFAGAAFAQVPSLINYQGRLTDTNGDPVTGSKNFSISIYDAATGGNLLYTEDIGAVTLDSSGVYSFQFGAGGNSSKQATETVAATNGTATTFQKVLANSPVVAGSVSVSDGTYTWSQSAGSSNEDDFGVAYSTNLRRVTVIYYNGAPAAGRTITASYRYTDGSISGALATGSQHWMAISVSGLTQGTRQRVLAVPFALNSQRAEIANSIPDGVVTAAKLADGALRDVSAREGNVLMTAQKRPDLEAEGFVMAGSLDLTTSQEGSEYAGLATYGGEAVWTGTEMIVWNGSNMPAPNPDSVVINGGRYNPVTDTWAAISSTGEPRFSYSHTAVWAGTEMIVFGAGNNEVTNSIEFMGGRYNPVTDTWTTTSSTGAPTFSQYSNTAVWTGTEMIVFGEGNNSITNNREFTGGRYNPVTNTWTTMSSTEAPTFASNSSDSSYTAIWAGTEMIVFGRGESNGIGYNGIVGLRYNPVTNRWATISSKDSPTLGSNLSAVWTGTDMIVSASTYDLYDFTNQVILAYKYNLVTDTWTEISLNSTPKLLPAGLIYSLWTGTEMIVLGSDYDRTLKGGRYDPASDTWNVIFNPNFSERFSLQAPPDTTNKIAFWTGSTIIFYDKGDLMSKYGRILIITPRQTFMYVKP
jgi:hypothetical protein